MKETGRKKNLAKRIWFTEDQETSKGSKSPQVLMALVQLV